jgi:uncharacterized membrane protein
MATNANHKFRRATRQVLIFLALFLAAYLFLVLISIYDKRLAAVIGTLGLCFIIALLLQLTRREK